MSLARSLKLLVVRMCFFPCALGIWRILDGDGDLSYSVAGRVDGRTDLIIVTEPFKGHRITTRIVTYIITLPLDPASFGRRIISPSFPGQGQSPLRVPPRKFIWNRGVWLFRSGRGRRIRFSGQDDLKLHGESPGTDSALKYRHLFLTRPAERQIN